MKKISVLDHGGAPICPSFSFSQIPSRPDLFIGKYKHQKDNNICGGRASLAIFKMEWKSLTLRVENEIFQAPAELSNATIENGYDPYVEVLGSDIWVVFECTGPHITGTSACLAPLLPDLSQLDLSRLTIPVVGRDQEVASNYTYSASTPKLINYRGHIYLYWTAIKSMKEVPHTWLSIETRGSELELYGKKGSERLWVKGRENKPLPSFSPGTSVSVMRPEASDPIANVSVDTEGLFKVGNEIVVLSSVGGKGPDGMTCTKPRDKVPGCFQLRITKTSRPLSDNCFNDERLTNGNLPKNPAEYPRIVTDPNGRTYLMVNLHPPYAQSTNPPDARPQYQLLSLDIAGLKFAR